MRWSWQRGAEEATRGDSFSHCGTLQLGPCCFVTVPMNCFQETAFKKPIPACLLLQLAVKEEAQLVDEFKRNLAYNMGLVSRGG